MLARLAGETGGRMTRFTNDLSLGYARAQRDLSCRYTAGFYLRADLEDKPRRMALSVLRPGLRVLHPNQYMFRSKSAKRESEVRAAFFAPEIFGTGNVRAHVLPLQPRSPTSWDTLIAVSFPVRFDDYESQVEIDFGVVVNRGAVLKHSFNRRVSLRPKEGSRLGERRFMFLEPSDLEPGEYELTVVAATAGGDRRPDGSRVAVAVPAVTRREPTLVQPILGRPRDENIVVRGDGPDSSGDRKNSEEMAVHDIVATKGSFEPMLVQIALEHEQLLTRTKACLVGRGSPPVTTIERSVNREGGQEQDLTSVPLALGPSGRVRCQNVFEILPDRVVDPGPHLFEARIEETPRSPRVEESLRFAVEDSKPPPR